MLLCYFFFFKQKTAYEMRISDWSSDVCSSDLWRTGGSASRMSSATIRPLGPDPATVARSILRSAARRRANGVTLIPFDSAAGPKLCSGVCTALKGSSALLTATGALTTGPGADAGEAATGERKRGVEGKSGAGRK